MRTVKSYFRQFFALLAVTSVSGLRCYDGSAFHLGDSFIGDALLRPPRGLRFTNWNYIIVKSNCSACSSVLVTQEPRSSPNTPTAMFQLRCETQQMRAAEKKCLLNKGKFKSDIDAMQNVDLANLQLSDQLPEWEDQSELKERVSSRLLHDLKKIPIRELGNARRTCNRCFSDLCNYLDMNFNVSCSLRFGIQSIFSKSLQRPCPTSHGCFVQTNITWNKQRTDQAACVPHGCPLSLSRCDEFCGVHSLRNKKCSCWCNGGYTVKSYRSDPEQELRTNASPGVSLLLTSCFLAFVALVHLSVL